MKQLEITPDNKSYLVKRYCDYVLSRMNNDDMYDGLKDYFFREKMGYPIKTLTNEINRYCPEILEDHLAENVLNKSPEFFTNT